MLFTSLVTRCRYFHDKKIAERKNDETGELGIYNGRYITVF